MKRTHTSSELPTSNAALVAKLEKLNQDIRRDPQNAIAYNDRGLTHAKLGDLEAALADLNRAIELDSQDAEARYNRGIIHDELGNTAEAIADYTQFLALHPAEDEGSARARERITALGGQVP